MNDPVPNANADEQELVKLYTQLTGQPETAGRSVFMYVCPAKDEPVTPPDAAQTAPQDESRSEGSSPLPPASAALLLILACLAANSVRAADTNAASSKATAQKPSGTMSGKKCPPRSLLEHPLSLADAVNIALKCNPKVLLAQKDLEAAQGVAVETRAIALPGVGINGSYTDVEKTDIDIIPFSEFNTNLPPGTTFGTTENWSTQLKLVQSIYQGGRMLSAVRSARLIREEAMLNYRTALADSVLDVQLGYYDVLLAAEQIGVQEASVELLTSELEDTTRRFEAGTVPRFNVLRAEVELANARPNLIRARSNYRITKNALCNLLGFDIPRETLEDIPLTLSDTLVAEPYDLDLTHGLDLALEQRTELASLRKAEALRKEDIINAKSGYKPMLQGYVGYDAHNSMLSQDIADERYGWIVGAQLSWNIFDGLRTHGRVQTATANYERAGVELDDTTRRIELEVRTAYSVFLEAREVLESQKKAVDTAEEALRLARARYDAGTGVQLDVLSSQTALTDSRSTLARALHDYSAARARLEHAIGNTIPNQPK